MANFLYPKPVQKYWVFIGSKFLKNNNFNSVFNQIFAYVRGMHCLIVKTFYFAEIQIKCQLSVNVFDI